MDNILVFAASAGLFAIAFAIYWFKVRTPAPTVTSRRTGRIENADGSTRMTKLKFHRDGRALCPNCGEPTLRGGPSGGLSQNCACESCLHECNIVHLPGGPFVEEQRGKMDPERAAVFGIMP